MSNKKVRAIAFYLPQFYPTPENDEWWEPGFTEWTNVARAKPLFKGHYQPRIPRDLGFYDLRVPETREKQAQLAREAGIEGFCYWHYWFGNGKRLLADVFREVVETGKPDFPFCLCWANHSWYAKTWDPNVPDKLLVEQTYPGEQDYIDHFYAMLPAFKDKRYIKVNGKLLFGIFAPEQVDIESFKATWNKLSIQHGLTGFHFFALCKGYWGIRAIEKKQKFYDTVVLDPMVTVYDSYKKSLLKRCNHNLSWWQHKPYTLEYREYIKGALKVFEDYKESTPCINPNFDHSPRSGYKGLVLKNSSPDLWRELCQKILNHNKENEHTLLFIKSWNEWGEGNYLEPDSKWGTAYIKETAKVFK